MFGGELLAAEQYRNAHRMFFDYFDLENAPDFVSKFEARRKQILNAYDEVNITLLNVEDAGQIAIACALSMTTLERRVLQVVIPLNAANNQLNYAAAAGNVMLQRSKARLEMLTPQSREFWRYFIKKQPDFVSYSKNVYSYYATQYRLVPLKIDSDSIAFTDEERKQLCRSRAERFLSGEQLSRTVEAQLMVSDNLSDRWLAMLYGVPIVLINMPTYTLDYNLIVRSEKSPMLMLPRRLDQSSAKMSLSLFNITAFEEHMPNFNVRMQFYAQNGMKWLDNTPEEIAAAVEEMLARLNGSFEYDGDEEYMDRTVRRVLKQSKDRYQRDIFDGAVSIEFLKHNQPLLGVVYAWRDTFKLKNILPPKTLSALTSGARQKIKLRVYYWLYWNAMQTICEACVADAEIELLIITDKLEQRDKLSRDGYNCVFKEDYNVVSDKPDVFFINYFGVGLDIRGDVHKYAKLVVVASQSVLPYQQLFAIGEQRSPDAYSNYAQLVEKYWGVHSPDFYLFDSYVYGLFKDLPLFKDKSIVEAGNPKYDLIFRACRDVKSVSGWEKLDGKTVVFWSASHYMWEYRIGKNSAFDIFAQTLFQYMESHPNMAMIFRPHPGLIKELPLYYWSKEELSLFRRYCTESSNVVFDETADYVNAFALSSAIITDIDSGIRMSALPTMKPICLAYRSPNTPDPYEDLTDYCYQVHTTNEMLDFLDMIGRGDDPLHDIRERAAHAYVKHFDGKNGWRIKEFLKQVLRDKTQ